jgi:rRNA maturation endonuclease Nob1
VTQTNDTSKEATTHVIWCKQCQKIQPHTTTNDAAYCDVCGTRWTVVKDEVKK